MDVLKRFDIAQLADRLPTELSGGQQQRVALCRAVINDPPLMFADEPVGNLDSKASEKVMELLLELNERDKKTVILVTHDPRYLRYAHRVFYLKDGELVREVVNKERSQHREEKVQPFATHALTEFAQYYPNLDEDDLKAKSMAHSLIPVEDEAVQSRLEHFVRQYFAGQLNKQQFIFSMNKSFEAGGVGYYEPTAIHLADDLEGFLRESAVLHDQFRSFPDHYETLRRGIEHLRNVLLAGYDGRFLSDEQLKRLEVAIKARLEGSIDHHGFREELKKRLREGGVGLHHV